MHELGILMVTFFLTREFHDNAIEFEDTSTDATSFFFFLFFFVGCFILPIKAWSFSKDVSILQQ